MDKLLLSTASAQMEDAEEDFPDHIPALISRVVKESPFGPIDLCYDLWGNAINEPLLLIMGLGTQMIGWRPDFCQLLVNEGFYVIRFDNRDIGLSSKLTHLGMPSILKAAARRTLGLKPKSNSYDLEAMASDGFALLDALGIDAVHICGASMGGMIAQVMALQQPGRVKSLVSLLSSTGSKSLPLPRIKLLPVFLRPPPKTEAEVIEEVVTFFRLASSPKNFDENKIRQYATLAAKRSCDKQGVVRQLNAILISADRKERLRSIRCPTLVIHGKVDPVFPIECGRATASVIAGSQLIEIDDLGHELPESCWHEVVAHIATNARRFFGGETPQHPKLDNVKACQRCHQPFRRIKPNKHRCNTCNGICCTSCVQFEHPHADNTFVCGTCYASLSTQQLEPVDLQS